jgi:hypothetical protein
MEEAKPTLFPHWREALRVLLDEDKLTYGSTLSRERIASLCRLRPPRTVPEVRAYDLKLMGCIIDIRRELLIENQMHLVSDNRGGYSVCLAQDQTSVAVGQGVSDIKKALRKTATVLAYTNTEMLTDEQRRCNSDAQAKLAMLAGMHRKGNRELIATTKK